eukprot:1256706-Lingulodinium_polyedra.AAC.1
MPDQHVVRCRPVPDRVRVRAQDVGPRKLARRRKAGAVGAVVQAEQRAVGRAPGHQRCQQLVELRHR